MRELYTDLNIRFSVDQTDFYALNIVFERFQRTIPNHSHGSNSYEIHYISSGYGQVQIGQVLYDLVPGTLYITGPHIEHAQIPAREDPMCEYCIYLKAGKPRKLPASEVSGSPGQPSVSQLFTDTFFWFGPDSQNIHTLMQQIFFELRNQYTGYMIQVRSLLAQLIIHTVRNYEMKQKALQHFEPSNLVDSKFIILEEYFLYEYQNLSLEDLARRLGLGIRQTERLLKDHYGKTFLQKKNEAKMAAAAILLEEPGRRISSIAEELGYSSSEHFSAAFKRYYGMSAREYRKSSEKQEQKKPQEPGRKNRKNH